MFSHNISCLFQFAMIDSKIERFSSKKFNLNVVCLLCEITLKSIYIYIYISAYISKQYMPLNITKHTIYKACLYQRLYLQHLQCK